WKLARSIPKAHSEHTPQRLRRGRDSLGDGYRVNGTGRALRRRRRRRSNVPSRYPTPYATWSTGKTTLDVRPTTHPSRPTTIAVPTSSAAAYAPSSRERIRRAPRSQGARRAASNRIETNSGGTSRRAGVTAPTLRATKGLKYPYWKDTR